MVSARSHLLVVATLMLGLLCPPAVLATPQVSHLGALPEGLERGSASGSRRRQLQSWDPVHERPDHGPRDQRSECYFTCEDVNVGDMDIAELLLVGAIWPWSLPPVCSLPRVCYLSIAILSRLHTILARTDPHGDGGGKRRRSDGVPIQISARRRHAPPDDTDARTSQRNFGGSGIAFGGYRVVREIE
jgi:hypothetical protein